MRHRADTTSGAGPWVRSSRSAASGWRRRSTASSSRRPASSGATRSELTLVPPAVVLVTGVSRWLGGALAAEPATHPAIDRVIGVDTAPPAPEVLRHLGRTEFVRADIRSPLIGKVIESASVDTVVHMNISATTVAAGGRASMKELNVIGTMQLLAACQRSTTVRRLVLKSTSAVYGPRSRH